MYPFSSPSVGLSGTCYTMRNRGCCAVQAYSNQSTVTETETQCCRSAQTSADQWKIRVGWHTVNQKENPNPSEPSSLCCRAPFLLERIITLANQLHLHFSLISSNFFQTDEQKQKQIKTKEHTRWPASWWFPTESWGRWWDRLYPADVDCDLVKLLNPVQESSLLHCFVFSKDPGQAEQHLESQGLRVLCDWWALDSNSTLVLVSN